MFQRKSLLNNYTIMMNKRTKEEDVEITTPKKRCISPEERQQIIEELRLVPKKMYIFKNY